MFQYRTYNPGVLLGNWFEERVLEKEERSAHLYKEEGHVSSTHLLNLISESDPDLIDCSAMSTDGYLRFGSNIQIVNTGSSPYYVKYGLSSPRDPHVVSLSVDLSCNLNLEISNCDDNFFKFMDKNGYLNVTASKNIQPSAKNIFKVLSLRGNQNGRVIRYGEPIILALQPDIISLKCPTKLQDKLIKDQFLYLASDLKHIGDPNLQPEAQDLFFEVGTPTFLSQWRLEYEDPHLRREMEGRPVKADQKLLIKHVRSNKALALEPKFTVRTLFGKETCLSVRTYYDSHKLERDVNVWVLASARQQGLSCTSNEQTPHKVLENTSLEGDCVAGANECVEKNVNFE
uniref:Uncharacterized protein n=1 Tax=Trichobilharzia regenti TaxID=157069 RepID=A0AA85KI31_TRIRE|nr:unnamed protein product [Trichobilharzia regenti]